MPAIRVSKELNDQTYFVTFTVRHWYNLFNKYNRWGILADMLTYYQKLGQLKIYGYVFMLNHLHLIVQPSDVAGFLRNFKSYTAQLMIQGIKRYEPSILSSFCTKNGEFQVWQKTNMPIPIFTEKIF